MSTHSSVETSWPIRAIGNSGASASGPTGSRVCGWRGVGLGRHRGDDVEPGARQLVLAEEDLAGLSHGFLLGASRQRRGAALRRRSISSARTTMSWDGPRLSDWRRGRGSRRPGRRRRRRRRPPGRRPVADAALGDQDRAAGQGLADGGEAAGVDLEGGQVAGVPPTRVAPASAATAASATVWTSTVQAGLGGLVQQGAERGRVEGGHDQQDRVGPRAARASHTW